MSTLERYVDDYLRLRRTLGYQLEETIGCCTGSPRISTPPAPSM